MEPRRLVQACCVRPMTLAPSSPKSAWRWLAGKSIRCLTSPLRAKASEAPRFPPRAPVAFYAATSSIVLYGLASFSAMSSLMIGHAGSISLVRQLNLGLRG